jgi:tetratricopeptide (TPR) repeat protein
MKRAIIIVFCLLVGIMAAHGETGTTGHEDMGSCISTEIQVAPNCVKMPLGRIMLVRKGSHYCAVKFTEGWTGETIFDCFENYEAYDLGDGIGNPFDKSVLCEKGQLISRRYVGIHHLIIPAGHQNEDLKCGPIKLFWTIGAVYFCDLRKNPKKCDYSIELAPTKWTDISQVNLFDPRLKWYKDEDRKDIFIRVDQLWEDAGDFDKTIADYTKAIEINPKDAIAFNNRGNAWYRKGDYDKAIADYTKAIEINPKDAIAYYNRGFAWDKKGYFDKAIADYTKAIEIDPKYAKAYYSRGFAWDKKGDYGKAKADYDKAKEINPKLSDY